MKDPNKRGTIFHLCRWNNEVWKFFSFVKGKIYIEQAYIKFGYCLTFKFTFEPLKPENSAFLMQIARFDRLSSHIYVPAICYCFLLLMWGSCHLASFFHVYLHFLFFCWIKRMMNCSAIFLLKSPNLFYILKVP